MKADSWANVWRAHAVSFIPLAARVWFGTASAAILLDILWRAFRTSAPEIPLAQWSDGVLIAGIVLASSWHYVRGLKLSPAKLIAVGLLWAMLSFLVEAIYRAYAIDHYVVRLLMTLFLGDYRGSDGWLWKLVLAIQLFAPLLTNALQDALSRRALKHELRFR